MKIKDLPKIDRPREKLEKTIEQFENRNIKTGDGSLFGDLLLPLGNIIRSDTHFLKWKKRGSQHLT